jgi:hypothetical protein
LRLGALRRFALEPDGIADPAAAIKRDGPAAADVRLRSG